MFAQTKRSKQRKGWFCFRIPRSLKKVGMGKIWGIAVIMILLLSAALSHASPAQAAGLAAPASPASIIHWNAVALRTAQAANYFQTQSLIYISFAQAAVYDAVVNIQGGYHPYHLQLQRHPGASVDAAVATAAYRVLLHYFDAQQGALDADYAAALAAVADGAAKNEGVMVGQMAADSIIALRQGDGLEANIGFTMPAPGPGVWQLPGTQVPQTPWVSKLKPFMLLSPDQFRPGPPPELTSSEWAVEFNEVKVMGRSGSPTRTAEQTDIARFWSTNSVVQYNTAFQRVTMERGLDAVQAARLFAMGDLVGSDALIACFDAKYQSLFWRPIFAVRQAGSDGNPDTAADPTWTPLLATPNHPEYPAAHGCYTSAEAEVFAAFFGTNMINIDLTSTVANLAHPTRHFDSAGDLVREVVNARVWGGLHYRESVVKGASVGRKVAKWTMERYFLPAN